MFINILFDKSFLGSPFSDQARVKTVKGHFFDTFFCQICSSRMLLMVNLWNVRGGQGLETGRCKRQKQLEGI